MINSATTSALNARRVEKLHINAILTPRGEKERNHSPPAQWNLLRWPFRWGWHVWWILIGCVLSHWPESLCLRTFVHIGMFLSHALLLVPITAVYQIWCLLPSSCFLMMRRLFLLLLGCSPSIFLLTILYHGGLCRLWGQFNGSFPQSHCSVLCT